MLSNTHFLTIGAGPVGLSISMLLQQKGEKVSVYEKRPDPRLLIDHGRSINLALSDRGFRTLDLLNVGNRIKKDFSIAMKGRMIHDENGKTHLQPYSSDGQSIYSVSRSLLNNLLLNEAEEKGIEIHFEHKCVGYDSVSEILDFDSHSISTKNTTILATDGAFSPLRQSLKSQPNFFHKETKLDYSYKELCIPAGKNGEWLMEKHALHIWPRKNFMLIALPNTDGSFTCTLFLKSKAEDGKEYQDANFESLDTHEKAIDFFHEYFPDALNLMHDFENDFEQNPTSSLFMETCAPWNIEEKLLLLGDAAHAIVPFYGQGLNAGLEDARILCEAIVENRPFSEFQRLRKPDTDAIGELALQNFIEMRDLVTDETFLKKRKLEASLKKIYGHKWTTQYELVTFSHSPYTTAQMQGLKNNKKLDIILENDLLTEHLLQDTVTEQDMYLLSLIVL